jgi:hypothetical protein
MARDDSAGQKAAKWKTRCGQGMSVLIEEPGGTVLRVRKAPSEVIVEPERERLVVYPAAGEAPSDVGAEPTPAPEVEAEVTAALTVAAESEQPTLGPEFDSVIGGTRCGR